MEVDDDKIDPAVAKEKQEDAHDKDFEDKLSVDEANKKDLNV